MSGTRDNFEHLPDSIYKQLFGDRKNGLDDIFPYRKASPYMLEWDGKPPKDDHLSKKDLKAICKDFKVDVGMREFISSNLKAGCRIEVLIEKEGYVTLKATK